MNNIQKKQTIKVLVVDDNEVNQIVSLEMLSMLGFQADLASDGEEALKKHVQNHYNLILMDILMPGLSGIETSHRIRNDLNDDNVIIISMSAGNIYEEDNNAFTNAGINDYLTKPFHTEELKKIIQKWFSNSD
ncbi:MAG: response regulator [Leptospiraceae bacterium]|nr:response regulator [Leptospiraceae bacterium]MCP5494077.1 response regulator [Leptospiraceae bacterium]